MSDEMITRIDFVMTALEQGQQLFGTIRSADDAAHRIRLCDEALLALVRESERADADGREQTYLMRGDF